MEVSKYNKDSLIAEFGLKFNEKLAPVEGRMLPPPQVSKTNRSPNGAILFNQIILQFVCVCSCCETLSLGI